MEQIQKPKGFVYEMGKLAKYTSNGRKRRNWKQDYRLRSRKKMKHIKNCQVCGDTKNLTIHHKVPLHKEINLKMENLIKVCRKCHDIIERRIKMTEYILLDELNITKLADSLKGYGIIIELQGDEAVIKVPSGKEFYNEFVYSIIPPKMEDAEPDKKEEAQIEVQEKHSESLTEIG